MSTLPLPESREAEIKRNSGGRLTAPDILRRKRSEPLVMLTAYTARMAEILDQHCDLLLVGDSLAQVIYGLPTTLPVSLEMMATHGAAVVRGSKRALVVIDMPFRTYEEGPEQAFRNASWLLKETGAGALGDADCRMPDHRHWRLARLRRPGAGGRRHARHDRAGRPLRQALRKSLGADRCSRR